MFIAEYHYEHEVTSALIGTFIASSQDVATGFQFSYVYVR